MLVVCHSVSNWVLAASVTLLQTAGKQLQQHSNTSNENTLNEMASLRMAMADADSDDASEKVQISLALIIE